jgi:kexin
MQWHLHEQPAHVHTQEVCDQGIFGKGVRIAIVDDGIQTTHPDVKDNVRLDSSYNFNRNIDSPDPTYKSGNSGDWHGTASAGTAAARDDGVTCGVGAAPHAELAGIAILQNNADVSDEIEAKALSYRYDLNHIYSNSWGPIQPGSNGHKNEAPGTLAAMAILKAINEGRNGLGSIYVWAAGNDEVKEIIVIMMAMQICVIQF